MLGAFCTRQNYVSCLGLYFPTVYYVIVILLILFKFLIFNFVSHFHFGFVSYSFDQTAFLLKKKT